MSSYWLSDAEDKVLGPLSLDVLRDLAVAGKLAHVRMASKDGREFVPVEQFPEVRDALVPPSVVDAQQQQAQAIERLRAWLEHVKPLPTPDVFRIPPDATPGVARNAFFSLIRRFAPDRLPNNATAAMREVCEDIFLHLAERMVDFEKAARGGFSPHQGSGAVIRRGGVVDIRLHVTHRESTLLTGHPDFNVAADGLFVNSDERVAPGTPVNLTLSLEGLTEPIVSHGRVLKTETMGKGQGFGIKLLDITERQRIVLREWLQPQTPRRTQRP